MTKLPPRRKQLLLRDDRLHQIARVVYVVALVDGDVVGEELQRNHFHDGQQQLWRGGDVEDVICDGGNLGIAVGRDRYQRATAGFHFLHDFEGSAVAQHGIRITVIGGSEYDDRQFFIDQRVGAVFEFARG